MSLSRSPVTYATYLSQTVKVSGRELEEMLKLCFVPWGYNVWPDWKRCL